jgi:sulfite reductase (NADPH) flavoprotein alpha-component
MSAKESTAVTSPLSDQQVSGLQQLVKDLSPQQSAWISGYFWGLSQNQSSSAILPSSEQAVIGTAPGNAPEKLTIIYASQTGNAKGLAYSLKEKAELLGIAAEIISAGDYKGKKLAKEAYVIFVASTNGEGEPPDDAIELHEFLQSKKAPKLADLNYAVLALGDSSYEFFCKTGKDFDQFLLKLGAHPIAERLDCDVDYEIAASEWSDTVLLKLKELFSSSAVQSGSSSTVPLGNTVAAYSKHSPYSATFITKQKITGRNSSKDVRHIEIDLENSGISYQPGDALGVWYENDPQLVDAILAKTGLTGDESIEVDGESIKLKKALISKYEITASNPQLITKYAQLSGSKKLAKLLTDKDKLRAYSADTQLIDLLAEKKTSLTPEQLLSLLRRLTPRLYSISSSQAEVDEEVHLTVGLVEYQHNDESRLGGASGYLAQRLLNEGDQVKVFVETNSHFKLPEDDNAPVIMIGPGTGVAPFRSFVQERDNRGASGKNWLFFGDRSFTDDFLYQVEWQKYLKSGVLSRMDVAFSRDQKEKIYVQDRLLQHAQQVWQWIEDGAYIYLCGDAGRMAKDVNKVLLTIIEKQGKQSREQAEQYLNELRKVKRYQKDVY